MVWTYIHKYKLESFLRVPASKYENEIKDFLFDHGIICRKDKTIISPNEIDMFCYEYNIGIEFNGSYWHSDLKKDKMYHMSKSLLGI